MSQKTRNIIGWILAGLVGALFIFSAVMKFMPGEEAAKASEAIGLTADTIKIIGVVELLCIVLFLIPRTGIVGTLLLAAYLGGAIATHLEHGQPIIAPCVIQAFVWITAFIRFPELGKRLMGTPAAA
jgi:DoxX-like family